MKGTHNLRDTLHNVWEILFGGSRGMLLVLAIAGIPLHWSLMPWLWVIYGLTVVRGMGRLFQPARMPWPMRFALDMREPPRVARFKQMATKAEQAKVAIRQVAQKAEPGIRKVLERTIPQVEELANAIVSLAQRAETLERFLALHQRSQLEQEVERLAMAVQDESDSLIREQRERTLEQRRAQLENYDNLTKCQSLIAARMEQMHASLDNVHSQVMRISVAQVATEPGETQQLTEYLDALRNEFESWESEMQQDQQLQRALLARRTSQ